ncbi:MAG: hypothetical protein LBQ88_06685 [Treponema sp.]|jgi:hypothetical protein|nr:hypothetical protein [Treponema sp.]
MKSVAIIGWIILGLVQMAAMLNGLTDVLGGFFGVIIALILGEIPIVGTLLGIRGAIINWDWSILQAIGLFVGAPILIMVINAIAFRDDVN